MLSYDNTSPIRSGTWARLSRDWFTPPSFVSWDTVVRSLIHYMKPQNIVPSEKDATNGAEYVASIILHMFHGILLDRLQNSSIYDHALFVVNISIIRKTQCLNVYVNNYGNATNEMFPWSKDLTYSGLNLTDSDHLYQPLGTGWP